jgi:hypothetical protein
VAGKHGNDRVKRAMIGASKENKMEDFPIWLKLIIWGTISLTVIYSIWGMLHSYLQS